MGIVIQTIGTDSAAPPGFIPIRVTLDCDKPTAFFCRGIAVFESSDGFIGCHASAMKAGWLERQAPQGRIWLCPECSGK